MKVFLSWSGSQSRAVANALRDWLPSVLQQIEPWLSSEDIPAGSRWASEISSALENAELGVLCLTPENLNSQWLNFEAGALSRVERANVCVFAVGIEPSDVTGPLSQFQVVTASQEGTSRLLDSLNQNSETPLPVELLTRIFERWWPDLEVALEGILESNVVPEDAPQRPIDEKVDEILSIVQQLNRNDGSVSKPLKPQKAEVGGKARSRPRIFIGSSSEGLPVAEAIQLGLDSDAECTIWNQSVFGLSGTTIETLVDASRDYDFAVIVMTPDDDTTKRARTAPAPRDNIIFELGLFTGALGRARTFMVFERGIDLHLPSDISGVTAAVYASREDGNLHAALGPVCTRIKQALGVLGPADLK